MKVITKKLDITKWRSFSRKIIQPHIHQILSECLNDPENCWYRGGFGRKIDYNRMLRTGSDYLSAHATVEGVKRAAVYASPLERVGSEPWCRGFDPLYWALSGHSSGENWNPINCLVAYSLSKIDILTSEVILFESEQPLQDSIEAVILLEFDKTHKF